MRDKDFSSTTANDPHMTSKVIIVARFCSVTLLWLLLLLCAGCSQQHASTTNITLTAYPVAINAGESSTLHWSSTNATRVVSSNFEAMAPSGSVVVTPDVTTAYTITVSGDGGRTTAGTTVAVIHIPPQPMRGINATQPFYVNTANYFYLYDSSTAPFDANSQLGSSHYPVPLSYQTNSTPPAGFALSQESERVIRLWAQADPRVAIVSGVSVTNARIKVLLVDGITYGSLKNIIGLTKLITSGSDPHFEVYVATQDPISKLPMTFIDLDKTLMHELGHAFGLGHSPDKRDLMYFQANSQQGAQPSLFCTYGDAMAIWTTLTNRMVNWMEARPPVTPAAKGILVQRNLPDTASVTDGGGQVVCVYTK